jgi:hypothetical protein
MAFEARAIVQSLAKSAQNIITANGAELWHLQYLFPKFTEAWQII